MHEYNERLEEFESASQCDAVFADLVVRNVECDKLSERVLVVDMDTFDMEGCGDFSADEILTQIIRAHRP